MATEQQPLPNPIDKRTLLWAPDPKRPVDAVGVGDQFAELGRYSEALDFYERIPESNAARAERFDRVKKVAIQSGSAFLLGRLASRNLIAVSKDDWKQLAHTAKAAGELRYALRAAIQAGDDALTAELRATLGDAVPKALAAQPAESPEQAKVGVLAGQKVEAVAAAGAAHSHEPAPTPPAPPTGNGNGAGLAPGSAPAAGAV